MYVIHECLTGTDDLYNPLLLGVVNDVEGLAASSMELAPHVWFNMEIDSGNGFGVVCSASAFVRDNSGGRGFYYICKIEDCRRRAFAVPGCLEGLGLC